MLLTGNKVKFVVNAYICVGNFWTPVAAQHAELTNIKTDYFIIIFSSSNKNTNNNNNNSNNSNNHHHANRVVH